MQGCKANAQIELNSMPFLYEHFNFEMFFTNPLSPTRPVMVRILNALIRALNKHEHLPQYIIVIPDIDILTSLKLYDFGVTNLIDTNLTWLLKQLSRVVITRRENLKQKQMGAAASYLPISVWVKMLQRPYVRDPKLGPILVQHNKFNRSLESILHIEKYMKIIAINDMDNRQYFNAWGGLTSMGALHYWRWLDLLMKNLVHGNQQPSVSTPVD